MTTDKFPPYPNYRRTEGWLERVPDHWTTTTLGKVTLDRCDGPFGSGLKSEHYTDAGVQVVRLQNIKLDGFSAGDPVYIDAEHYNRNLSDHGVVKSDVLIAGLGDPRNPVGRACVAPPGIAPAMVKADCFRFRLDQRKVQPEFVALQLSASSWFASGTMATGSTRARIPLSSMAKRPLAYCPKDEQAQIAKFLDYETAKIDALIEKQQQLIALLKEKRQAVISHAVTKGLNPDAPMRDSGVEWLGEVPAHWEVVPFRHALQVSNGQVDPRISPYSAMPLVAPNHIESGTGRLLALESAEEQGAISGKYQVREGDVIYSKIRPALRKVTVAPQACLCSADMYALRPTQGGAATFFSWLLLSEYFSGIVVLESMRVAMPKVNRETLAPIPLPVPAPTEQRAIADHLSIQASRLDALVDKADASMDLLRERRTALISAAVTGKIDVRGWKAPDSELEAEVA